MFNTQTSYRDIIKKFVTADVNISSNNNDYCNTKIRKQTCPVSSFTLSTCEQVSFTASPVWFVHVSDTAIGERTTGEKKKMRPWLHKPQKDRDSSGKLLTSYFSS